MTASQRYTALEALYRTDITAQVTQHAENSLFRIACGDTQTDTEDTLLQDAVRLYMQENYSPLYDENDLLPYLRTARADMANARYYDAFTERKRLYDAGYGTKAWREEVWNEIMSWG